MALLAVTAREALRVPSVSLVSRMAISLAVSANSLPFCSGREVDSSEDTGASSRFWSSGSFAPFISWVVSRQWHEGFLVLLWGCSLLVSLCPGFLLLLLLGLSAPQITVSVLCQPLTQLMPGCPAQPPGVHRGL